MKSFSALLICFFTLLSCQHKLKTEAPFVDDIVEKYLSLPQNLQKSAFENEWHFFTYTYDQKVFNDRLLKEFPSLSIFGNFSMAHGKHPLDIRPYSTSDINPMTLIASLELETELLSRFHSANSSPQCIQNFWSQLRLPLNKTNTATFMPPRTISQVGKVEGTSVLPLDDNAKRLALFLRMSLGLAAETPLELVKHDFIDSAQFRVTHNSSTELYDIFKSEISCQNLKDKKFLLPVLGKLKCLQKQSSTWISVPAREADELSAVWDTESKERCERWTKTIIDELFKNKKIQEIQKSSLSKSWSLYPRLKKWIQDEASRYQNAFRNALMLKN